MRVNDNRVPVEKNADTTLSLHNEAVKQLFALEDKHVAFNSALNTQKHDDCSIEEAIINENAPKMNKDLSPDKIEEIFRIKCNCHLEWLFWSPGCEYNQKIRIQNLSNSPVVLQHELPKKRTIFRTDFPDPFSISSGMTKIINVQFCPVKLENYADSIRFNVSNKGSFLVELDAPISKTKLLMPKEFFFENCAVNHTKSIKIPIRNNGTSPANCFWEIDPPFQMIPAAFEIYPSETICVLCRFTPVKAAPVITRATCYEMYSKNILGIIRLSGIGKYAFVEPPKESDDINFGLVNSGSQVSRTVVIRNLSPVEAYFFIQPTRLKLTTFSAFNIQPSWGIISSQSEQKLSIDFTPCSSGVAYGSSFECSIQGGNQFALHCRGTGNVPKVLLSSTLLNFGEAEINRCDSSSEKRKTIKIQNNSSIPVSFELVDFSNSGPFLASQSSGMISAYSSFHLTIQFLPRFSMQYARCIQILVSQIQEVLQFYVMGSGYYGNQRSFPLTVKSLVMNSLLQDNGLGNVPPLQITKLFFPIENNLDDSAKNMDFQHSEAILPLAGEIKTITNKMAIKKLKKTIHLSTFWDQRHTPQQGLPFSVNTSHVVLSLNSEETFIVNNFSNEKAHAVWCFPLDSPVVIIPENSEIPPLTSATFKVCLNKRTDEKSRLNKLTGEFIKIYPPFSIILECYVSFSRMLSFRLTDERILIPPVCFPCVCSFNPASQSIDPQALEVVSRLDIPACSPNDTTYQLISIKNNAETPITLKCTIEAFRESQIELPLSLNQPLQDFACFPTTCVLQPKHCSLLLIRFQPSCEGFFKSSLVLSSNIISEIPQSSESLIKMIVLCGVAIYPAITVNPSGPMCFPPTHIGDETQRLIGFRNSTPMSLFLQPSSLSSSTNSYFRLHAPSGLVLSPWEFVQYPISFSPSIVGPHSAVQTLNVCPEYSSSTLSGANHMVVKIPCLGSGGQGSIVIEPIDHNFGTVMVGNTSSHVIKLTNSTPFPLWYQLYAICSGTTGVVLISENISKSMNNMHIEWSPSGSHRLPGRTHTSISVSCISSLGPCEIVLFAYTAATQSGLEDQVIPTTLELALQYPSCRLQIMGIYPTLRCTEIDAANDAKVLIWDRLSIPKLNRYFEALYNDSQNSIDPLKISSKEPSMVTIDEHPAISFEDFISRIPRIDGNIGEGLEGAPPTNIRICLVNTSSCSVLTKWITPAAFMKRHERWKILPFETTRALASKSIDIQPQKMQISSHSRSWITLQYSHEQVGHHSLPIVCEVYGHTDAHPIFRVVWWLHGRTIPLSVPWLTVPFPYPHQFMPVSIGNQDPPIQYICVENPTMKPVTYHVDTDALEKLWREIGHGFPIFECLQPYGHIPPQHMGWIPWYFRPIESKEYNCTGVIYLKGSDDPVSFPMTGVGYNSDHLDATSQRALQAHYFPESPERSFNDDHRLIGPHWIECSTDCLKLGPLVFGSVHRKLITLKNISSTNDLKYQWIFDWPFGNQMIQFEPPHGVLKPQQEQICRMSITIGYASEVIWRTVQCHVTLLDNNGVEFLDSQTREFDDISERDVILTQKINKMFDPIEEEVFMSDGIFPYTQKKAGTTAPEKISGSKISHGMESSIEQTIPLKLSNAHQEILHIMVEGIVMPPEQLEAIYGQNAMDKQWRPLELFYCNELTGNISTNSSIEIGNFRGIVQTLLMRLILRSLQHPLIKNILKDVGGYRIPYFCSISAGFGNRSSHYIQNETNALSQENSHSIEDKHDKMKTSSTSEIIVEKFMEQLIFQALKSSADSLYID